MAITTDIGTLIVRNPEIRGNRPILAGTGVSVRGIVVRYKRGLTPEEIADSYGHLSLAQVYAALAYYHANQEVIEADLEAEDKLYDQLVSEQAFDPDVKPLWAEEAERRYQEYLDGKVEAVPGEEALKRIRAALDKGRPDTTRTEAPART